MRAGARRQVLGHCGRVHQSRWEAEGGQDGCGQVHERGRRAAPVLSCVRACPPCPFQSPADPFLEGHAHLTSWHFKPNTNFISGKGPKCLRLHLGQEETLHQSKEEGLKHSSELTHAPTSLSYSSHTMRPALSGGGRVVEAGPLATQPLSVP